MYRRILLSAGCDIAERQAAGLQAAWSRRVPVLLWDESWSTRRAVGPKRRTGAAVRTHAAAASIVLHEVLEALAPLELVDGEAHQRELLEHVDV